MALISVVESVAKIDQLIGISIVRDQRSEIKYNRYIYPWTPKEFIKELKQGNFGSDIAIVWGTTRHTPADCRHPGYISDSMYIPEIIQNLYKLNKYINFKSFLDIDVTNETREKYNFILCGDGEVNYLAKEILDTYQSENQIKYIKNDEAFFDCYSSRAKHNMYGVVQFLKNPWNENGKKFIIQVGGIGPIGTIAGLKWLSSALDPRNDTNKLPHYPFVNIFGKEKDDYGERFMGYKNHCEVCSIVDNDTSSYYRSKISNIVAYYPINSD